MVKLTSDAGKPDLIPEGRYLVEGKKLYETKADSNGNRFDRMEWKCIGQKNTGHILFGNLSTFWFQQFLVSWLTSTGLMKNGELVVEIRGDKNDPNDLNVDAIILNFPGRKAVAVVKIETNERSGNEQNTITKFEPYEPDGAPCEQPPLVEPHAPPKDDTTELDPDIVIPDDDDLL